MLCVAESNVLHYGHRLSDVSVTFRNDRVHLDRVWRVHVVVTWLYAVYSDWVISNLCSGNTPNYTLSGFAPFKNGYSEYPFLTLTLYHIRAHWIRTSQAIPFSRFQHTNAVSRGALIW
jgi:hypothetical protein